MDGKPKRPLNVKRNLGKHIQYDLQHGRYVLQKESLLDRLETLVGTLQYDRQARVFHLTERQVEWLHNHNYLIA